MVGIGRTIRLFRRIRARTIALIPFPVKTPDPKYAQHVITSRLIRADAAIAPAGYSDGRQLRGGCQYYRTVAPCLLRAGMLRCSRKTAETLSDAL